jgi:hypothetical protein
MASRLEISNQAVALIRAKAIQSLQETSLEARECNRFFPQVVSEMLEGPHDWSFANRRVVLAQIANTRESEWLYAYAVPSDMGSPIRVIPDLESLGLGLPVPLPGNPYAETWAGMIAPYEAVYRIENGVIYTNVETATLEYGINSIDEVVLPALVVRALAHDLAARLAVPVKGDTKLETKRQQEADLFWDRAMADDQNRHPQRYGDYISEAMAARAGWLT